MRDKFYREPQSESAMWARKHTPDLGAPLPGLGQQTLPATMPSIDFRLVWHTGRACGTSQQSAIYRAPNLWPCLRRHTMDSLIYSASLCAGKGEPMTIE